MTFTYDLASSDPDTLNASLVRLELGDTTEGSGVRPNGSNLTDEELAVWLTREDDDVLRAAAAANLAHVGLRISERGNAIAAAARHLVLSGRDNYTFLRFEANEYGQEITTWELGHKTAEITITLVLHVRNPQPDTETDPS